MANDTSTTALQNLGLTYSKSTQMNKYLAGQYTSHSQSGPTSATTGILITSGPGRLVRVCILVTDGTLVDFYDSASANIVAPVDWVYSLQPNATPAIYEVGIEFTNGLVMVIAGNTTLNVTYSAA